MHSRRKFPGTLSLNSAAGSNSLLVRRYFRRAINISGKSSEKKEVVLSVLNPARSTLAFNSDKLYRRICREYSSIVLQRKECCGTLEEYHPLGALPGTFARGLIHHPQCVLVRQKRRSHQNSFSKGIWRASIWNRSTPGSRSAARRKPAEKTSTPPKVSQGSAS